MCLALREMWISTCGCPRGEGSASSSPINPMQKPPPRMRREKKKLHSRIHPLRDASGCEGTLPRPKKHATGMFFTSLCSVGLFESRHSHAKTPSAFAEGRRKSFTAVYTPYGMPPAAKGLSPGLKNMPLACFLPRFARSASSSPINPMQKPPPRMRRGVLHGVGDGTRTHNAWNHNPVLCQLNYTHHALWC